jgi:hypothetical protein
MHDIARQRAQRATSMVPLARFCLKFEAIGQQLPQAGHLLNGPSVQSAREGNAHLLDAMAIDGFWKNVAPAWRAVDGPLEAEILETASNALSEIAPQLTLEGAKIPGGSEVIFGARGVLRHFKLAREIAAKAPAMPEIKIRALRDPRPLPDCVSKDGVEVPVSAKSAANAGFTWPVANPRQRFQNMKVEFPNMQPGGVWEIQLIDGSGAKVGPPAVFNLEPGDPDRELYLRYEKP